MRVGDICTRAAVTCGRDTSARELARLMCERHVGDVVVVDADGSNVVPVGVVTDRDLVVRVLARGGDPETQSAGDLMDERLVTAVQSEHVHDAIWHMRSKGVRCLPIVDAHDRLVGVLTADDVARFLADELSVLARIALHETHEPQAAARPPRDTRSGIDQAPPAR
jgi:CBS domain-containing protein